MYLAWSPTQTSAIIYNQRLFWRFSTRFVDPSLEASFVNSLLCIKYFMFIQRSDNFKEFPLFAKWSYVKKIFPETFQHSRHFFVASVFIDVHFRIFDKSCIKNDRKFIKCMHHSIRFVFVNKYANYQTYV